MILRAALHLRQFQYRPIRSSVNRLQPILLLQSLARRQAVVRQLIIRSADDLAGLWSPDAPREPTLLRLELPGFEPKTLRRWEDRLNSRLNACGCMAGAALALLTLLGIALWQGLFDGWSLSRWPIFEIRAVPAVAIAMLAGKVVGIRAARWDLRRVVRRIERRLH